MNKKVIMSLGLSAAALSLSTIDASAAQTAIVTTSVLNVRTGAGTNYSIMSKVYKGDTLEVIGSLNGWYNIKLSNGKTGWVSGDYLSISGSSTNTESKKGTVTTDTLNVRSGAGTSYSIISKVYKGDTVNIVGSSNGWYKIELSSGKTGWVSGDYVSVGSSSDNSSSDNATTENKKGTVTTDTLNVRSGAGTSYSIISKVHKGDTVNIVGSSNGWYKIELSSGKTGWVSSDYVSIGSSSGSSNGSSSATTNKAQAIVDLATKQIGKPYVWGAEGPSTFDCSGLTYYVFKNAVGISLPRTSTEQSKTGTTVSKSNLQPGDLIFSSTNGTGNVSHVGIYIGNNEMIHAPKPGDVVKKTKINNSYWENAYLWAKRYI